MRVNVERWRTQKSNQRLIAFTCKINCERRVLVAQLRRKRGRSLEEYVDLVGVAHREMRGQLPCPSRYDGQYLRVQFVADRPNRKFRRHESHRFAQNRSAVFATLL